MALQDIAQVSISLNTSGVSRAGFGTPMFLTAHNSTTNRVDQYTSAADVAAVFGTDSNAYQAALSTFSNDPSVDVLKIGRIIADSDVTPVGTGDAGAFEVGVVYTINVTDSLGAEGVGTYTTVTNDTAAEVVVGLLAGLNAASLTGVTFTSQTTSFNITRDSASDDFTLSNISNVTVAASSAEDIVTAYTEVVLVDNDFYAVATEDHTTWGTEATGIYGLAKTIEADDKVYFIGSSALATINDTFKEGSEPSDPTDILGYLTFNNFARSIGWWHQDAGTTFNELAFAGFNLPFDAGSVVWGDIQVPVSNAINADGNKLTSTQQQNLSDRNANWQAIKGNIKYSREGKVAAGEWIDNIRGRDNLKSDLEADLFDLLTNQKGRKIPYIQKGINQVANLVATRLNDYKVNREFLTDPITINIPKAKDISREDKVTRILNDLTFTATLAGAIMLVDLTGTLEV